MLVPKGGQAFSRVEKLLVQGLAMFIFSPDHAIDLLQTSPLREDQSFMRMLKVVSRAALSNGTSSEMRKIVFVVRCI